MEGGGCGNIAPPRPPPLSQGGCLLRSGGSSPSLLSSHANRRFALARQPGQRSPQPKEEKFRRPMDRNGNQATQRRGFILIKVDQCDIYFMRMLFIRQTTAGKTTSMRYMLEMIHNPHYDAPGYAGGAHGGPAARTYGTHCARERSLGGLPIWQHPGGIRIMPNGAEHRRRSAGHRQSGHLPLEPDRTFRQPPFLCGAWSSVFGRRLSRADVKSSPFEKDH